jgi:hypothetical protein
MKLSVKAFAIACALIWGLGIFCLTWWIIVLEGAGGPAGFLGRIYPGYAITPLGSLIGLVWALIDGFLGGLVFAWLYNKLAP